MTATCMHDELSTTGDFNIEGDGVSRNGYVRDTGMGRPGSGDGLLGSGEYIGIGAWYTSAGDVSCN